MVINSARIVLAIYGVLLIVGGVMGFAKGSKISLIAGGISGLLALAAYVLSRSNPKTGLGLGVVVTIAMIGSRLPPYLKTHNPAAGAIAALSVLTLIVLAVALMRHDG